MKPLEILSNIWAKLSNSNLFWYVVFGGFAYWGFKRLTKAPENSFLDTPIPNGGKDIPVNWSPVAIVEKLHSLYESWLPSGNDFNNAFSICNSLTDGQFVYMVKYYNATYAKIDGQGIFSNSPKTLWTRLNTSKFTTFGNYDVEFGKMKERMIRFKLNY